MESWEDQGIVLSVRPHGENGAVVSLLTEGQGRHCGYVRGIHSAKMRALVQPGSMVSVDWQSRISENLGGFKFEQVRDYSSLISSDGIRLSALLSACSLCDATLPEREVHPGMFHGLKALMDILSGGDEWGAAYVYWEIALLRELGFSLDLSKCAGGGRSDDLFYVSPRTGRAVSRDAGEPYKDKLLSLPSFLRPGSNSGEYFQEEVVKGLKMTGHFLEHWALVHSNRGFPEARARLLERISRRLEKAKAA